MTVVFGIPIPSSDPLFLAVVAIHVAVALAAVLSGAAAMLATKGSRVHIQAGSTFFWSLCAVFVTASALATIRWQDDAVLFALGAIAFSLAVFARSSARHRRRLRRHATGMAGAYIVMLTAFYVDNGKNLPMWRDLPPIAYWFAPTLVGVPILIWALLRHPLLRTTSS